MREDNNHMALVQCNFRLPKWQKRQVARIAEDEGKTLEGFMQDLIGDALDARADDLAAEAAILTAYADDAHNRQKFAINQ